MSIGSAGRACGTPNPELTCRPDHPRGQSEGFVAKSAFHENLGREERIKEPSNRSFGFTVAAACLFVGVVRSWVHGEIAYVWLAIGLALAVAALVYPRVLTPLNKAWMKLGLVLFKVISPVMLALLYYGCFVPMGLLMRAMGKDPLRLKREPEARSYWIKRTDADRVTSMKNQF